MNMKAIELNEKELDLVNGGADDNAEKSLLDILNECDFDVTKDPFYFPDHKLPWEIERPDWLNDPVIPFDPDLLKTA